MEKQKCCGHCINLQKKLQKYGLFEDTSIISFINNNTARKLSQIFIGILVTKVKSCDQLHTKCKILFCELWTLLQLHKINPKFKSLFPSPVVINVWLLQSPVSAPARLTKFARYLQAQTSRGVNIATFLLPQFNSKVSPVQCRKYKYSHK